MDKIIIDKKDYESFENFYEDIVIKMDAKNDLNCLDPENLSYNPNHLWELLEDYNDESITFIFKNFDLEKIKNYKTHDDYEWKIVLETFQDFITKFPNNKLVFENE